MSKKPTPLRPPTGADALTASYQVGESHDVGHAGAVVRVLCVALLAFLAWAATAPVHEIVTGEGTIQPEGSITRVEHLDGGIVEKILVVEGDPVVPEQPLLHLDGSDLRAEARKLDGRLSFLEARIRDHDALLSLDLANTAPAPELAVSEEIGFHLAQIGALRAQAQVATAQRAALRDQIAVAQEETALQDGKIARYARVSAGSVSQNDRDAVQRDALALRSTLVRLLGEVAIQDASIALFAANEAELIGRIRTDASQSRAALIEERDRVAGSLAQIEAQIDRLVLRSDRAGRVGDISVRRPGEVLAAGETVLEIVPQNARPLAEIEIPAGRIGGVEAGSLAKLKVLTYDFTRFGEIDARVARIAPTSVLREDGSTVYRVTLDLLQTELSSGRPVVPGLTVVADIRTERRTVLSYLLKPLRVLKDRAFTES